MKEDSTNDFDLHLDETVLWKQLISNKDEEILPPKVFSKRSKIWRVLSGVLLTAAICFIVWDLYTSPSDEFGGSFLFYIWVFIVVSAVSWLLEKSRLGQKYNLDGRRDIYQNAILTNKRLVLFNHNPRQRREFQAEEIREVAMDYENGGYALRITPTSERNAPILIGVGNFQEAVDLIHTRLLKRSKAHT